MVSFTYSSSSSSSSLPPVTSVTSVTPSSSLTSESSTVSWLAGSEGSLGLAESVDFSGLAVLEDSTESFSSTDSFRSTHSIPSLVLCLSTWSGSCLFCLHFSGTGLAWVCGSTGGRQGGMLDLIFTVLCSTWITNIIFEIQSLKNFTLWISLKWLVRSYLHFKRKKKWFSKV